MMNPELKAKWTEALRSGKYPQGRLAMKKDEGFCCLGVLADVIDPDAWSEMTTSRGSYTWNGCTAFFGIDQERELGIRDEANTLMSMNDSKEDPKTFAEIADYIDQKL